MISLVPSILAATACAAFLLKADDLLAARRTGKGKGKASAGKAGRKGASAPGPPRGGPPASPARAAGGPSGRPATGGPGDGTRAADGAAEGGGGPPEFPKAPAWAFRTGDSVLDIFREDAEESWKNPDSTPLETACSWDDMASSAYAALGPDDPVPYAALSRAALALAGEKGSGRDETDLAAAAALAAWAAQGMSRVCASAGRGGTDREPCLREEKFALDVLAALRGRLGRLPGRSPEGPFPAPACRLSEARRPGAGPVGGPSPGCLLSALEAAEESRGPGSPEALSALSRLGAAVADEEAQSGRPWQGWEAWKDRKAGEAAKAADASSEDGNAGKGKAAGEAPADAGKAEGTGDASAEALLRSASEGLDALLGRTHPESLDARERLARFLAGGSGPGLPLDPLPCELPAEGELLEAMDMFLETAWTRAAASPRARASSGGPGPEAGTAAGTPELLKRLPALLRLSRDRAAFAAAAAAAECDMTLGGKPSERSALLAEAGKAADHMLGPAHPTTDRFRIHRAWILTSRVVWGDVSEILSDVGICRGNAMGASAREAARADATLARLCMDCGDYLGAMPRWCGALQTLELPRPSSPDGGGGAPDGPGLPPGPAGRDRLAMRLRAAECALTTQDGAAALGALAPFLGSLPRLPPSHDGPGDWPWPAELAGYALGAAGEALKTLGDYEGAEELFRRCVATVGPDPSDTVSLCVVFAYLAEILEKRGDEGSLREAAAFAVREAEIWTRQEGPRSVQAAGNLREAADYLEAAGDAEAALELRREARARRQG
jgi:tetratricopeptide (TPR) repeat protein